MNTSISIDAVVKTLRTSNDPRSLAERFIDAIRPYQLKDAQIVPMFDQVKLELRDHNAQPQTGSWILFSC
jgi:hypothetical protein